jgi:hypothetical protein
MHVSITGVNEAKNAIQDSYCWDLKENSFSWYLDRICGSKFMGHEREYPHVLNLWDLWKIVEQGSCPNDLEKKPFTILPRLL